MPRIRDSLLECVLYLYPDDVSARAGARAGGTGFLVHVPLPNFPKMGVIFVVTNSHVVNGGASVARINTKDGGFDVLEIDERTWVHHPRGDDICIAGVGLGSQFKYLSLSLSDFLTPELVEEHKIGPGDDIFVIGRFVNHEGAVKNKPTVRFGAIAQMPGETIKFSDGSEQDSFLVEARSIPGYSGAPVFLELPGFTMGGGRQPMIGSLGPWLLGVDHCHLASGSEFRSRRTGQEVNPDWYVVNNTGMMGVVPAWRLTEIFRLPSIAAMITAADAETKLKFGPDAGIAVKD